MNQALINKLFSLVEEACKAETNRFGYGIWTHHIKPMVPVAQELAALVGADLEIVTIAALLHDYAGIKDGKKRVEHHIHGAEEAERILSENGYPNEKIELVKRCVLSHRSSVRSKRHTKEEQCIADADAIVHIEQLPSLFYVAYHEVGMGIDEGAEWVKAKIGRDWNKMSRNGKRIIKDKYEIIKRLLE